MKDPILPVVHVYGMATYPDPSYPDKKIEVSLNPHVIPWEEIITMDQYEKLIENGSDARITVGSDMGHQEDFGNIKAGAFVSITLSCAQDEASIAEAVQLAQAKSQSEVFQHFVSMWEVAKAGVMEAG